jgi:hypothetical protein
VILQLDEYHDVPQDGSDDFNDDDDDDEDDDPPVAVPTKRLGGKNFHMQVMDD